MLVVFRVDASLKIGTGHVMRCLALAKALRQAGSTIAFICRELPGNLIERVRKSGIKVFALPPAQNSGSKPPPEHAHWAQVSWKRDSEETAAVLQKSQPDWLVVDHYGFDSRWERAVRQEGMRLMVIDDLADRPHDCEILLDQNLGRQAIDYAGLVAPDCRCFIGPRYALLRPQFSCRRAESLKRRLKSQLKDILVSMGGIDQDNVTARVLDALEQSALPAKTRIAVVLGANAPWLNEVEALAAQSARSIRVLRDLSDMATLMFEADLAVGAPGSTSWERCCLGVPSIIVTTAENQRSISRALVRAGVAVSAGDHHDEGLKEALVAAVSSSIDASVRKHQSELAAQLCDGDGVARLCNEIMEPAIGFRNADMADARRIWDWRRFPGFEQFSKKATSGSYKDHCIWLERALEDPDRIIRILELGQLPCGYVRLDLQINSVRARVSVCLGDDARGRGLAGVLLHEAESMTALRGATHIDAEIHVENEPSTRAFTSAGYVESGRSGEFATYEKQIGSLT